MANYAPRKYDTTDLFQEVKLMKKIKGILEITADEWLWHPHDAAGVNYDRMALVVLKSLQEFEPHLGYKPFVDPESIEELAREVLPSYNYGDPWKDKADVQRHLEVIQHKLNGKTPPIVIDTEKGTDNEKEND